MIVNVERVVAEASFSPPFPLHCANFSFQCLVSGFPKTDRSLFVKPDQEQPVKTLQVVALTLLFCCIAVAQDRTQTNNSQVTVTVPRWIRFSGQVSDATGTVGITFSLHKDQRDSEALWIETQNVRLTADGRYTVLLGATKADGVPMELFTSGDAQWLGVRVENQPEQPRVLLVSVPYALKAAEAETLAGHAASEFVTTQNLGQAVEQQLKQTQLTDTNDKNPALTNSSVITNSPTNFSGTTANQVVLVSQGGTGAGLAATAAGGNALRGTSTGTAVFGQSTTTSGSGSGVQGNSASSNGAGIFGINSAASGTTAGVKGTAASPAGYGVFGHNSALTGISIGVNGRSDSTGGIAVRGLENASTGSTIGMLGSVSSPSGTAGVFQNLGGGKLFSGQSGSNKTEVFSVNGSGTGMFTGAGLPAIIGDMGCNAASAGVSFGPPNGCTSYALMEQGTALYVNSPAGGAMHFRQGNKEEMSLDGAGNLFAGGGTTVLYASGDVTVGQIVSGQFEGRVTAAGFPGFDFGLGGETGGVFYGGDSNLDPGLGIYAAGGNGTISDTEGGTGLIAWAGAGYAAPNGYAGEFSGDVKVIGTVSSSTQMMTMDHPSDPANKYLEHAAVQSSEMMNVYSGNITTNAAGEGVVHLPDWFEDLNGDFRYQLTPIGQFAQLVVAEEISHHQFRIKSDKPNIKVSWQVTGVRRDAYAKAHPLQIEVDKTVRERGFYLYPELYGAAQDKQMEWVHHPDLMKQKQAKARGQVSTRASKP
jgi:hypothetical protein